MRKENVDFLVLFIVYKKSTFPLLTVYMVIYESIFNTCNIMPLLYVRKIIFVKAQYFLVDLYLLLGHFCQ